jgi:pullulanase/glycogen debranching enzyme
VQAPEIPYHDTIIYEAHVKGFTYLHPDIPEDIRGTYAGIAHPSSVSYLKKLGITAIELMPVHHFISDRHLQETGIFRSAVCVITGVTIRSVFLRRTFVTAVRERMASR